jgi:alpha-D-ribose 1-methylphosphonate 5-triphosphate synthase subunit PhnH
MFLRRLGPDPHTGGRMTRSLCGCPDILETENGDFAVIGKDITAEAASRLIAGASCGPDERIVLIPRDTLVLARPDIPEGP